MKIGCISWSHRNDFASGRLDLPSWMEHCKNDARLDGAELWNNHFVSLEPDYLSILYKKSLELELPIYSVATKCVFGDFTLEEVDRAKQTLRDWLKAADALRAPLLRVSIGGKDLRNPSYQHVVFDSLSSVIAEGVFPGIRVGIENQEPGLVQNAEDVKIMTARSKGALCLVLDNGSFIDKADSYAFTRDTLDVAGVVHTKFFDVAPNGSDRVLDYARVRDIIAASAYRGYLSIEYDSQQPAMRDVPRIADYMRTMFSGV